ncbi:hypothetical protein K1719_009915 [Acacia pycnantha]|nr:hypothetical protein K1719_009915 [Acacia pycnantha]
MRSNRALSKYSSSCGSILFQGSREDGCGSLPPFEGEQGRTGTAENCHGEKLATQEKLSLEWMLLLLNSTNQTKPMT